jgi:hypothetical protein
MSARRCAFVVAFIMTVAVSSTGRAQPGNSRVFGDLLKRIPEHSNILMLVNVDGLFNSPMGQRENWRQQALENHKGSLGLASEVSKAAVAASMDFTSMQERWKIGMVQLRRDVPIKLDNLANREGGYVETIENTPVAWTPRGFYLFDFPDNLVGFASPTDRKALTGWFRSALWHPRNFPPGFADRAIFRADAGAQIVLALDLDGAVSAKMVEPWLNSFDVIKKTFTDAKLLSPRLASVKSAFLVVKVDQGIEGNLRIDFGLDVDYTAQVARTLILDLLDDYGAEIPEMKTWSLSFDKKTAVEMSGRMSVESVRKVLSMAHLPRLSPERTSLAAAPAATKAETKPATKAETKPAAKPAAPYTGPQADNVAAAQAYFRSISSLVEGLKGTQRPTYRSTKLWYDRYAKQIEELPILGVDKDLLDWGAWVARLLREMSSGVNYYSQNQKYAVASDSSGYYGGYGAYYGNSRAYDQSVIKKQSDAMMSVDLDKRWQAIETSVSDTRRKMVEKYMVDF